MNGTVWVELTPWQGMWIDRTLFGPVLRLGFLGLGISRHGLTTWIKIWRRPLKKLNN